jgi:hypothetical protein
MAETLVETLTRTSGRAAMVQRKIGFVRAVNRPFKIVIVVWPHQR